MTGFPTALQQQKCPMGGNVGAASARSEISALLQWAPSRLMPVQQRVPMSLHRSGHSLVWEFRFCSARYWIVLTLPKWMQLLRIFEATAVRSPYSPMLQRA